MDPRFGNKYIFYITNSASLKLESILTTIILGNMIYYEEFGEKISFIAAASISSQRLEARGTGTPAPSEVLSYILELSYLTKSWMYYI